jgi:hypothetical protein
VFGELAAGEIATIDEGLTVFLGLGDPPFPRACPGSVIAPAGHKQSTARSQ